MPAKSSNLTLTLTRALAAVAVLTLAPMSWASSDRGSAGSTPTPEVSGERGVKKSKAVKKAVTRPRFESPRGAANRIVRVPGTTYDRIERGIAQESPRATMNRVRRVMGETPDRLDRGVLEESPRHAANRVNRVPGSAERDSNLVTTGAGASESAAGAGNGVKAAPSDR